jgi:plastocyanin domain-containing protein
MKALIIFGSLIVASGLMVVAVNSSSSSNANSTSLDGSNVSIVDGVQIITINARGGYQPRNSVAKSGIPTVVRFVTNNTYDCSSFVRFPSLNLLKTLPPTGTTEVNIGSQQAISLKGSCGMGMYPFQIDFKS